MNLIITEFKDLNNTDKPSIEVVMPHAVKEGDFVEIDNNSFRVIATCWVIDSYTGAVKLKVKMR